MKALGVGMMRRKLAGSVVPVNTIEISDDGLYTLRYTVVCPNFGNPALTSPF